MSATYVAGPDIDLDREVVLDKDGRRITERRAERIAKDVLRRVRPGRPSLTRAGTRSPEVKAGVPAELQQRVRDAAASEHISTSQLVRKALEHYLAS